MLKKTAMAFVCLIITLSVFCTLSFSDTLRLKNGTEFVGEIEKTKGGVVIEGMFIPDADIESIMKDKKHKKSLGEMWKEFSEKKREEKEEAKKVKQTEKEESTKKSFFDIGGVEKNREEALKKSEKRIQKIQEHSEKNQKILEELYSK